MVLKSWRGRAGTPRAHEHGSRRRVWALKLNVQCATLTAHLIIDSSENTPCLSHGMPEPASARSGGTPLIFRRFVH